jgi:hypothetical protein
LFRHAVFLAEYLALESAGSKRLARIAMMAITTSSSISVKPGFRVNRLAGSELLATPHRKYRLLMFPKLMNWLRAVTRR